METGTNLKEKIKDIYQKGRSIYFKGMAMVSCTGAMLLNEVPVHANNSWDFLTDGPSKNDPFGKLTETVKDFCSSLYAMVFSAAISIFAITAIFIALALVKKNANMREEAKERFLWLFVAGIIIFGITGLFSIVQSISIGIAQSMQ